MSKFNNMSLFKDVFSEALESSKMTASSLAVKIGLHRSRISDFANGGSLPKDDTLVLICSAFSPKTSAALASAWIRERLGAELADAILASEALTGTSFEKIYHSLPISTQRAFFDLMSIAREDQDLRTSLESLAAYARPEEPTNIVKYTTGGSGGQSINAVAEEHDKDNNHP